MYKNETDLGFPSAEPSKFKIIYTKNTFIPNKSNVFSYRKYKDYVYGSC